MQTITAFVLFAILEIVLVGSTLYGMWKYRKSYKSKKFYDWVK